MADERKITDGRIMADERKITEEREAAWWLGAAPGFGAVRLVQLSQLFDSARSVLAAAREKGDGRIFWRERIRARWRKGETLRVTESDWQRLKDYAKEWEKSAWDYHRWAQKGIKFITVWDDIYPRRLCPYPNRPFSLYIKGNLPAEKAKAAALIGARACSPYGRSYARRTARELAERGVQIISGLAAGIDSEGHIGALESRKEGSTFAVLGCGPDQCYPKEHGLLAERIVEAGGGLLSEFAPGTPPFSSNFPMRNRIISGLSDCILVMEARRQSGSLITVNRALDQGKDVFALPGRVSDPLSEGCNRLIQSGAAPLLGSRDVLELLFPGAEENEKNAEFVKKPLASDRNLVYSCLDCQGKSVQELMELTGLPLSAVREELLALLLDGRAAETAKGCYAAVD